MGEDRSRRQSEVAALRLGFDLGMTLIDTAEMYGEFPNQASHHIRENRAALDIQLTDSDLKELDQAFPPPNRKIPLEML